MPRRIDLNNVSWKDMAPKTEIERVAVHAIVPEQHCSCCHPGHTHPMSERFEEVHTHGLAERGLQELCIRNIRSDVAGTLINTIIAYALQSGPGCLAAGDVIAIGNITHVLVPDVDAGNEPVLRLHWIGDPKWQPEDINLFLTK